MEWSSMWVAVPASVSAVVVGVLTWLGGRAASASKVDEAEITTRGDEWQKIITAVQTYADKRIGDQDVKIGALEGKVQHLEHENELTKTKYWKAIFYGRSWRLLHPESVQLIEVPPEILDDL